MRDVGIIERYRHHLPTLDDTSIVTLLEGTTPLVRAASVEAQLLVDLDLYVKFEGLNPTGSFKDRGMTVAVSRAVDEGAQAVICASTGNTAASAAAYAARAGLECFVVVPEGNIALGKLAQSTMHGARVLQITGLFDEALQVVREIAERHPVTLVNSVNPYRIEGQKTAAFEVCDALGRMPDFHAMPVGNAGNITAYWKGYCDYHDAGVIDCVPGMLGFQAEGAAPIAHGHAVAHPDTVATAIKIGNPASWRNALAAKDESHGRIGVVTDDEITDAYGLLASKEGVFCEPASAAGVAGVVKLASEGYFKDGSMVVCTLTGHGLKDPDRAIETASVKPTRVEADMDALVEAMDL